MILNMRNTVLLKRKQKITQDFFEHGPIVADQIVNDYFRVL